MQMTNATEQQTIGTGYLGYLYPLTKPEIDAILGKPTNVNYDPDYSHFEWNKVVDGVVITVYDWKAEECDKWWVESEYNEFHVGGLNTPETQAVLKKLFGDNYKAG
jgi:hypothetical protein